MVTQPDKRVRTRNLIIGLLVVGVAAVMLLLWNWDRVQEIWPAETVPASSPSSASATPPPPPRPLPVEGGPARSEGPAEGWASLLGEEPRWPERLSEPDCREVEHELAVVCRALAERVDRDAADRTGGVCALLKQAVSELAARPPAVSSELRSYDAMLGNVFHVFRVLGPKRTKRLVETVRENPELVEPVSLVMYRWAISRERCGDATTRLIRGEALYAYAGFLFNTMGGQAYLRRRSRRLESMACFYALQVIDRAERQEQNALGLDPRPEIERCSALLADETLVFASEYRRALEDINGRWASR